MQTIDKTPSSLESDIWTPKEVAQYFHVCERYVAEKLAKQKGFPMRLPIGRLRWFRDEVVSWAYKNRKAA